MNRMTFDSISRVVQGTVAALALAIVSACSQGGPVVAESVKGKTQELTPTNSTPADPSIGSPFRMNTSPGDRGSTRKPLLLITGISGIGGSDIYTVSSAARDSLPIKFNNYKLEYFEPVPLPAAGKAAAVGLEKFGAGYSIEILNFINGASYTIYKSGTAKLSHPAISPDGKWIAFGQRLGTGLHSQVRVIHVESERVVDVPIAGAGMEDSNPTFSPKGTRLTIERRTKDKSQILAITVPRDAKDWLDAGTTSDPELLLEVSSSEDLSQLSFSSDELGYAYVLKNGKASQIIAKIGKNEPQVLTRAGQSGFEPTWSPDGSKIAYWTRSRDQQAVQVYDFGQGRVAVLTSVLEPSSAIRAGQKNRNYGVCPSWSFDGKEIYFASNAGNWDEIFKVSVAEARVIKLTDSNIPPSYICPRVMLNYEETDK